MQKGIVPMLWFNSNAEEAVDFYLTVFKDGRIVGTDYYTEVGEEITGHRKGDIRKLAKEFGTDHGSDHDLALALWESPVLEARLLAILLMKPDRLGQKQLDAMVRSATAGQLADWFNAYIVKKHPDKEQLRQSWMVDAD
ncbi:MAG: DNA alkylation repair protein, partial [Spirochaetota bacterium]